MQRLLQKNFVLVFCPSIALMKEVEAAVRRQGTSWSLTSVSSQDQKRSEKVASARRQIYKVLFTTMILERGVTFENVSVIVLGANHPVFTKSALVQI
ncbi:DNA/RNA helicase, partial [Escherichia coli]